MSKYAVFFTLKGEAIDPNARSWLGRNSGATAKDTAHPDRLTPRAHVASRPLAEEADP